MHYAILLYYAGISSVALSSHFIREDFVGFALVFGLGFLVHAVVTFITEQIKKD